MMLRNVCPYLCILPYHLLNPSMDTIQLNETKVAVFKRAPFARKSTGKEAWTLFTQGGLKEVLHLLEILDKRGLAALSNHILALLEHCVSRKCLTLGKQIHAFISVTGLMSNIILGNNILKMYLKCGSVIDAQHVFDKMLERDVISWTAMISGHVQHGNCKIALNIFRQMQRESVEPNNVTFICALKACAGIDQAKEIHTDIVNSGLDVDVFVGSTLLDMYSKCGSIQDALKVFNNMPRRNVVSWTAMVAGCAQHGLADVALKLFQQMQSEKVAPNEVTFASALIACEGTASLEQGKEIHKDITLHGFESDIFLGNTLVDMYVKCGSIACARLAFDKMVKRDLVSWNSMVAGYVHHGHCEHALKLYWQMLEQGMMPDKTTFVSSLKACAHLNAIDQGKLVHSHINDNGMDLDVILGSTLIDMYAKCGSKEIARQVFDVLPERDVIAWTAMISGCFQNGYVEEALELFWEMQLQNVIPDKFTFISALKACAYISALKQGKKIHVDIIASGLETDICVGSTLVDMYAKCGSLKEAREVFDILFTRDVVAWNAMIAGYVQHGDSKAALHLFEQMQMKGVKMDHITFLSILYACSRGGFVKEGRHFFDSMDRDHGINPTAEHYACMVDLFSRAGHLEEADDFIKKMPFQPSAPVWTTLLSACRTYGHVEIAKCAVERVHELEPQNAAASVLLSNIYNGTGRFDEKAKVRQFMESRGLRKEPGWSRIEIDGQVFTFLVDDMSHPQSKDIRVELQRLLKLMKEGGYTADLRCVLRDKKEEEKEAALLHHSERLAMVLGHMRLPPKAPIRIIKNLRVCNDCHTATKYMCKLMEREIIVRDATRFHHFKDGNCSCGDYW